MYLAKLVCQCFLFAAGSKGVSFLRNICTGFGWYVAYDSNLAWKN